MIGAETRRERLHAGAAAFDKGEHFLAHELWEDAWNASTGAERTWIQGMIQIAVACLKLDAGRADVAERMFAKGLAKLDDCGPVLDDVDLGRFALDATEALAILRSGGRPHLRVHVVTEGRAIPARFLVDRMVIKLGTWLRLLGYDTRHAPDVPDAWLLRTAREEDRVILTRDRALARERSARVHFVEPTDTHAQLAEVVRAFELTFDEARVLTRCGKCNSVLVRLPAADLADRVPHDVLATSPEVRICEACDHVYWHGSHSDRIMQTLRGICS